jgi:hypothetical protein
MAELADSSTLNTKAIIKNMVLIGSSNGLILSFQFFLC